MYIWKCVPNSYHSVEEKCLVMFRRGIGRRDDLILFKEETLVEDAMKVMYFYRLKPLGGSNINLTNNIGHPGPQPQGHGE